MNYLISVIIGLLIVVISIMIINREMNKSIDFRNIKIDNVDDFDKKEILKSFDNIDKTINEINNAFYEISNDLEGKYSIQDKEIELLNKTIEITNDRINLLENNRVKNNEAVLSQNNETEKKCFTEENEKKIEKLNIDKSQKIYFDIEKLKKQGYTNGQIAKKLNIGIGEVNLILNMK